MGATLTTTYHVLRTISETGELLLHLPTSQRIELTTADYVEALEAARNLRTATYRHRKTGEIRELTERQLHGCAFTNEALFQWHHGADLVNSGGYAIVAEPADLAHYEPKPAAS